jgi:hypothetical protein
VSAQSTHCECQTHASAQRTHCPGRQSRLPLYVRDLQGLKPSEARKAEPTEGPAHDAATVGTGASDHVHGTTKGAEGADHAHLHAATAAAGANGLSSSTVAPADAPGHEHDIAGAADAANPACTSPSAFNLDECMASARFRCGAVEHGAAATPKAKKKPTKSRKQVRPVLGRAVARRLKGQPSGTDLCECSEYRCSESPVSA